MSRHGVRGVTALDPGDLALPSGEVLDGEHYLLDTGRPAECASITETLTALGFRCAGQTSGSDRPGRPPAATAWITAP